MNWSISWECTWYNYTASLTSGKYPAFSLFIFTYTLILYLILRFYTDNLPISKAKITSRIQFNWCCPRGAQWVCRPRAAQNTYILDGLVDSWFYLFTEGTCLAVSHGLFLSSSSIYAKSDPPQPDHHPNQTTTDYHHPNQTTVRDYRLPPPQPDYDYTTTVPLSPINLHCEPVPQTQKSLPIATELVASSLGLAYPPL